MQHKAIVFDLDGTLLNTIDDLAYSMNTVLQRAGFPVHNIDQYKIFVGNGLAKLVERSLPLNQQTPNLVQHYVAELKSEYAQNWSIHTRLYPGISELLDELTARKFKLAILSNKADQFTQQMVTSLLSRWHFDQVRGAKPEFPLKPDPTAAIEIANQLRIPPQDFLYLGDSATDMVTANAAGMLAIGALWGFRSCEELLEFGAKYLISYPLELLELIK